MWKLSELVGLSRSERMNFHKKKERKKLFILYLKAIKAIGALQRPILRGFRGRNMTFCILTMAFCSENPI